MKEIKYYVSDDGMLESYDPKDVIKYEEDAEKELREKIQVLLGVYATAEVGYIAIINHEIAMFNFGESNPSALEEMKNRLSAATLSGTYGYIVDRKDINTKIYEVNQK